MRILKTKWFARFGRQEMVKDTDLVKAIQRAEQGLINANLGSGLIKQRVARKGFARSGGYRMIVVYLPQSLAIFVYGFAKKEPEDIKPDELNTLRDIAADFLTADIAAISTAMKNGALQEIKP
jgi:hypothetical protein